jgi:transcriptional regulator with XRE-family HTH domain
LKERLKELRKILGFKTQKDFSDDLGIPFSNVSSYEAGRRTPSDGVIALVKNMGLMKNGFVLVKEIRKKKKI